MAQTGCCSAHASSDVLDVRTLEPRFRHPKIFETFDALRSGGSFVLVNDHDPKPLLYQFKFERAGQFTWDYLEEGPEAWRVRIGKVERGAAAPTQPLREEHKEMLPYIEALRTVADSVGEAPAESLRRGVDEAYAFLTRHLLPHAEAEERALYPVVGKLMGAPQATGTMSRDHVEVSRLAQELGLLRSELSAGSLGAPEAKALRRVLYALYALVRVHFAKEEEVYLPLLDARLAPEEAERMFEAMHQAAKEVMGRCCRP